MDLYTAPAAPVLINGKGEPREDQAGGKVRRGTSSFGGWGQVKN